MKESASPKIDARGDVAVGVCRRISEASALLRRELDRILAPAGLTGPQFGILSQLELHGSLPLSELGKRLWVSGANVTGLVDKLTEAELVRRARPHSDRRVILAELTEKGRETLTALRPAHRECIVRFIAGLEENEARELQTLLDKICGPSGDGSGRQAESEPERCAM